MGGFIKSGRRKISLSEHNMDIETYRAKVKTEGVGNFERGTRMKLNLVMNETKETKYYKGEKRGKGVDKCNTLWYIESRFITTNVSEM